MTEKLILASTSKFRAAILKQAGIEFELVAPDIDERAVEAALQAVSPEDVATILAEAKAVEVSSQRPGQLVLGCDQTLSLGDDILHKAADMDAARRKLLLLSGRSHHLNSALVLARDGQTLWRNLSVATMTMRQLSPTFIGRYLAQVGNEALASVGAYQVEGPGIQLFEKIEGDYFSIIGLPLMPLLEELRHLGAIDG